MGCRVSEVVEIMENIAPPELAVDGDNVGLQFGSRESSVETVLLALEVNRWVVEEAMEREAGLIVCHHPPLFRPLRRLLDDEPQEALIGMILRSGISVYAAHTNLDAAPQGVNAALAEALGLVNHVPLEGVAIREGYKLVTFVPPEHLEMVSGALFEAGAGVIGEYTGCSFSSEGTGTFFPGETASPAYGERGRMNEVREVRLEVQVEGRNLGKALRALFAVHPYEEPAVDIYRAHIPFRGGIGRVGELPRPMRLEELADLCRRRLANPDVRFAGHPETEVRNVAVCGGSGAENISEARRAGAEVLVTGDVSHHRAWEALEAGLAIVDAGHYHTERTVIPFLARLLEKKSARRGLGVKFITSRVDTCPWNTGGAA